MAWRSIYRDSEATKESFENDLIVLVKNIRS